MTDEAPPILVPPEPQRPWRPTLAGAFGSALALCAVVLVIPQLIALPFMVIGVVDDTMAGRYYDKTMTSHLRPPLNKDAARSFRAELSGRLSNARVEVQTSSAATIVMVTSLSGPPNVVASQKAFDEATAQLKDRPKDVEPLRPKMVMPDAEQLLANPWILFGGVFGIQAGILAVLAFCRRRVFVGERALPPLHTGCPVRAIGIGVALGFVMFFAATFMDTEIRTWLKIPDESMWSGVADMPLFAQIAILSMGALAAPVCEELFFRGALIGLFQQAGRAWIGVLLSSILFGLAHLQDPAIVITVTFMGLMLGAIYVWTKSIYTTITVHFVNNAISFAVLMTMANA